MVCEGKKEIIIQTRKIAQFVDVSLDTHSLTKNKSEGFLKRCSDHMLLMK